MEVRSFVESFGSSRLTLWAHNAGVTNFQQSLLRTLATYRDIGYPKVEIAQHDAMRATIALHAMNHVLK